MYGFFCDNFSLIVSAIIRKLQQCEYITVSPNKIHKMLQFDGDIQHMFDWSSSHLFCYVTYVTVPCHGFIYPSIKNIII